MGALVHNGEFYMAGSNKASNVTVESSGKTVEKEITDLNQNLTTQDGEPFRYAKQDGVRGIIVNEGGADTFFPFKSVDVVTGTLKTNGKAYIDVGGKEILYLTAFSLFGNGCCVYDSSRSTTQYLNYTGGRNWKNLDSTTENDAIGKDANGFYVYHINMSAFNYGFIAVVK